MSNWSGEAPKRESNGGSTLQLTDSHEWQKTEKMKAQILSSEFLGHGYASYQTALAYHPHHNNDSNDSQFHETHGSRSHNPRVRLRR